MPVWNTSLFQTIVHLQSNWCSKNTHYHEIRHTTSRWPSPVRHSFANYVECNLTQGQIKNAWHGSLYCIVTNQPIVEFDYPCSTRKQSRNLFSLWSSAMLWSSCIRWDIIQWICSMVPILWSCLSTSYLHLAKWYVCKHSLGFAMLLNMYEMNDKTRSERLGKRRGKGRFKKVRSYHIYSSLCLVLISHPIKLVPNCLFLWCSKHISSNFIETIPTAPFTTFLRDTVFLFLGRVIFSFGDEDFPAPARWLYDPAQRDSPCWLERKRSVGRPPVHVLTYVYCLTSRRGPLRFQQDRVSLYARANKFVSKVNK
jgi:hypothetical protein